MKNPRLATARRRADRVLRLVEQKGRLRSLREVGKDLDLPVFLLLKDEVERLVRVDARRALRLASLMERLEPLIPDPSARAVARRAKAEALLFLGRYQKALETYRETIRLYDARGDAVGRARASVGQMNSLTYLSRYEEALRVARRTETVLRRHGERKYLGRLHMGIGNLYYQMDRYREALTYYRKARRILSSVSGRDEVVTGLEMNEAVIQTNLDQMDLAERLFKRAIRRARTKGWLLLAAQGESNLATVFFLQSRYQEALAALARAGTVFDTGDRSVGAIMNATRAEIYLRLNMADEAETLARSALSRFRKEQMRFDAGVTRLTLGIALARQGRVPEGRAILLAARRVFADEGNRVRTAAIDLHLARLFAAEQAWAAARRRASSAERALAARGLRWRAALARLTRTEVELAAGRIDQARELLAGITVPPDRLARFEKTFLAGRIAEADGRVRVALAAYRRASALAESVRASLAGEEHKIAIEGFRAEVAERATGLLLDRRHEARAAAEIFSHVESAKARALNDLLDGLSPSSSRSRHGASRSAGAARSTRLEEATRELAWYVGKLEQLQVAPDHGSASISRLAREVARREREIAVLHRRFREEECVGSGGVKRPKLGVPLALDDARRLLADEEIVIEYFAAREHLHALRIEPGGARVVALDIPIRKLEQLASRFSFQVDALRLGGGTLGGHERSLYASTSAILREAHALLIAPLGELPQDTRLTVIPHGPLHHLPFAALEGDNGPLATRARIAWAPSLASVARLRTRPASRRRLDLVGGHADPLAPAIRREISAVAHVLAARRPTVRHALASAEFLRLAAHARLIHLASHGRFRRDNPLFSAIRLADRWVYLYEILNLDLDTDLVVLSGCETGAGRHYAGEEIVGIARGFLARGARRLVVSQWSVDDPAAAQIAALFHEAHANGVPADEALRRASLAVRQEKPHPYYWCPFVLVGAGA